MSKKDLLGGDSQDRTQMMERSFHCPLFYCFHLIFSSLLEVAFLISLSSVPCLMETQGCFFFNCGERFSFAFLEIQGEKGEETEKQERMALNQQYASGGRNVLEGGEG